MSKKNFLLEKLKNRVLSSINERANPTVNLGEKWFYEPFNNCLRNIQSRVPNLALSGGTACYYTEKGDEICFESRHSESEKGGYFAKPSFVLDYIKNMKKRNPNFVPSLFDLQKYDVHGEWWCESGRKEPRIDYTKNAEHIKRMEEKEKNLKKYGNQEYWDGLRKNDLKKTTWGNVAQAKTMDDVKNGKGFIIKGMTGPVVKELQKMLLKLKYDLGSTKDDSIFGENTENALEKFQKDNGIIPKNNIYGLFGKITYEKMMEKLSNL